MTDNPVYRLERQFDAPPSLVWRAWTQPDLLAQWYGPRVETVIHQFEAKPGGLWLNEMRMEAGSSFQRTEFVEVDEPRRLVCLMANCNENWEVCANPKMPEWPRQLKTTVTFDAQGDGTKLVLLWEPYQPSEAEVAFFANAIEGLGKGWGMGMDLLEQLLTQLQ